MEIAQESVYQQIRAGGDSLQRFSGSNNAAYLQFAMYRGSPWETAGSLGNSHIVNFRNKLVFFRRWTFCQRDVLQYARNYSNLSYSVDQNIVKDVKSAQAITLVSFISNECTRVLTFSRQQLITSSLDSSRSTSSSYTPPTTLNLYFKK